MELSDALIITALGMGMTFAGLILTSLLILSFPLLGRLTGQAAESAPAAGAAPPPPAAVPAPDPDVLAVIAAVLEVELRLYHSLQGQRLTIARDGSATGWSDSSRLLASHTEGGPNQ